MSECICLDTREPHPQCPVHSKPTPKGEEWEIEFDKKFGIHELDEKVGWISSGKILANDDVKSFIRQLLQDKEDMIKERESELVRLREYWGKRVEQKVAEKEREVVERIKNLPIFADEHEREYQIGINEVWKQIDDLIAKQKGTEG